MKGDIFGADALYQYGDVIMVSHRPEMLNIRNYGPEKMPTKDLIYWHFLKVRDGAPMITQMQNNLHVNRVDEIESGGQKRLWSTANH